MAKIRCAPVNLDAVIALKRLRNHILTVGVELEGGWRAIPSVPVIHDGSVFDHGKAAPRDIAAVGEIQTPTGLSPAHIGAWVRQYHPNYVDATCGLHVHMKFRTAFLYERLLCEPFTATMIEYLRRWAEEIPLPETHPIWPRLAGRSTYCQPIFNGPAQILQTQKGFSQTTPGHRYTAVNYPFSRLGTVEVRLLPMMAEVDHSVSAIHRVLSITNAFLVATAKRRRTVMVDVPIEDAVWERNITITV